MFMAQADKVSKALKDLSQHQKLLAPFDMRKAFAGKGDRFAEFSAVQDDLLLDFSQCAMTGKTMNAGQICLAPDYVLAPQESVPAFVEASKAAVAKMYPTIKDNADDTAMINQRHYDRITGLIADAKAKGGEIVTINPANEDFSQQEHRITGQRVLDMDRLQQVVIGDQHHKGRKCLLV